MISLIAFGRSALLGTTILFFLPYVSAQVVNGDFEAGNTGFITDYIFATTNSTEGEYGVRPDPENWNGAFAPIPDHTSGAGNMLIVNGATNSGLVVWEQSVAVDPLSSYDFSTWVATAASGGPAELIVKINGLTIGTSFFAPDDLSVWENWIANWYSDNATNATIQIFDINTTTFPNDFYLDDITFTKDSGFVSIPVAGPLWLWAMGGLLASIGLIAQRWRN